MRQATKVVPIYWHPVYSYRARPADKETAQVAQRRRREGRVDADLYGGSPRVAITLAWAAA